MISDDIQLLIFDLDGTLVASESIAERVMSEVIADELGFDMPATEIESTFRGRTLAYTYEEIERRYGAALPDSFFESINRAYFNAIGTELRASRNVEDAIKALLPLPICVASNGEPDTISSVVELVGLAAYFKGNYFSAAQVPRAKPAPDVFLMAASTMGVKPQHTLVIEDTVVGITAGLSAGMNVLGYCGNHPESAAALHATGVEVIDDFALLPGLILQ